MQIKSDHKLVWLIYMFMAAQKCASICNIGPMSSLKNFKSLRIYCNKDRERAQLDWPASKCVKNVATKLSVNIYGTLFLSNANRPALWRMRTCWGTCDKNLPDLGFFRCTSLHWDSLCSWFFQDEPNTHTHTHTNFASESSFAVWQLHKKSDLQHL
jgi:hypothetical protein